MRRLMRYDKISMVLSFRIYNYTCFIFFINLPQGKRNETRKKYRRERNRAMSANPKTTEFLKECLADALIKLLETKPIEKITIPEIAEHAGVGRTTYFRNFSSKEEMLTFKLIQLWERWAEEHSVEVKRRYTTDNALTFFQFNYSIRALLLLMYRRGLQSALFGAFYEHMRPPLDAGVFECYKSSFYSYGLFGVLDEWISRDFAQTPEEMAGLASSL